MHAEFLPFYAKNIFWFVIVNNLLILIRKEVKLSKNFINPQSPRGIKSRWAINPAFYFSYITKYRNEMFLIKTINLEILSNFLFPFII